MGDEVPGGTVIDRDKLREALAAWFPTGWLGDFSKATDRILAILDAHAAPSGEPAAEAKEWRDRAGGALNGLAGSLNYMWSDPSAPWAAKLGVMYSALDEAVAHWGTGEIQSTAIDVANAFRQRAETAERERDEARAQLETLKREHVSLPDCNSDCDIRRRLEDTATTLARLLAEAQK